MNLFVTLLVAGVFAFPALAIAEPIPEPLSTPKAAPRATQSLTQTVLCSCVKFARFKGALIPYGTNASNFIPNSTPHVGGVAIFRYPNDYHVAYVTALNADTFSIEETNYHRCKKSTRLVSYDDPNLIGFWYHTDTHLHSDL